MNSYFEQDLRDFTDFLVEHNIQYKVVGSLALKVCGFPLTREPHDIDIETVGADESIFQTMAERCGNTFFLERDEYSPNGHKPYIFTFGSTPINVWCFDKFSSDKSVLKDGIPYDVVSEVIKRKMKYGRVKDYKDLIKAINVLLSV